MDLRESAPPVFLVTGAAGLLGSRLTALLLRELPDCRIIASSRSDQGTHTDHRIEKLIGDLRDGTVWRRVPRTISHVLHLAAAIPRKNDDPFRAEIVTDNLLPLAHLIEQCQHWPKLRQVIYTSSISVYAPSNETLTEDSLVEPPSLYGVSKLAGEQFLNCLSTNNVKTVSLRLSSLYAFGQYEGTVLPLMINRALRGQPLVVFGDGSRTQDFVHCEDAARAVLLAFQKEATGVYNIGAGKAISMLELARVVRSIFGDGRTDIKVDPHRADGNPSVKLGIAKARRELNYEPSITLETGLRKMKQEVLCSAAPTA